MVVRVAASAAARRADAILIGQPCAADELAVLMAIAGDVHDDGVVLVQTRQGRDGEGAEAVAGVLGRMGFRAQRRLNDKGRPIFIAHRVGLPTLSKAA